MRAAGERKLEQQRQTNVKRRPNRTWQKGSQELAPRRATVTRCQCVMEGLTNSDLGHTRLPPRRDSHHKIGELQEGWAAAAGTRRRKAMQDEKRAAIDGHAGERGGEDMQVARSS
jgi:hypothetical protein